MHWTYVTTLCIGLVLEVDCVKISGDPILTIFIRFPNHCPPPGSLSLPQVCSFNKIYGKTVVLYTLLLLWHFYMSCNHHTNHCKMKKYFALYIRIVWKYVFMVYRLEFHCLLLVMMQSQMFEVEHKRLMTFLCVTQLQPSSESLTANQCEG